MHTLAQDAGRDVPEDLTKAQLSALYPLAHLVVRIPDRPAGQ
ncbi:MULTISPECIES: hypothetical protein [Mycobacterium]|nr:MULTISPECIES: hypothetical protein [Mycobacterium]